MSDIIADHTDQDLPAGVSGAGMSHRRTVLQYAGAGLLTTVVVGVAGGSYRAFDSRLLGAGQGDAFDPWRHWRDDPGPAGAAAAGILAASPHNTQPWRLHIATDRIDLYADTSRRMGSVDPYGREMRVGLGAALENLVLGARARGYAPAVTLLPGPSAPDLVARVELAAGTKDVSPLYEAIGERHSNRGPYQSTAVAESVLAELTGLGQDPAVAAAWITQATARHRMGELLVAAAEAVTADEEQSRDGFAWFRSSADAIEAHRDGLTLDGQGLPALTTSLAKLMPASSRQSGDRFWVNQTRDVHARTAAAYGLILVSDPHDPVQQLQGGRLLQRIHLSVTARRLALQHMNQITERIDRDLSLGHLPAFGPPLAALAGLPDEPARQVLAAFRLGHPQRAGRLSPRRPLPWVTQ